MKKEIKKEAEGIVNKIEAYAKFKMKKETTLAEKIKELQNLKKELKDKLKKDYENRKNGNYVRNNFSIPEDYILILIKDLDKAFEKHIGKIK